MKNPFRFILLLTLTVGLAPFFPEPHIVGKLKWIAGGGIGMAPMDIFDLFLHGIPWLVLLGYAAYFLAKKLSKANQA